MAFELGINDAVVVSPHDDWRPRRASVGVAEGRIAYVGERRIAASEANSLVDGVGRVLMPGLVNGHCHGDMTVARGLGEGMTLLEQNQAFAAHNWFKQWLSDEDLAWSRQLTYLEALESGTTFILENSFWNHSDAVALMADTGIRGAIAMDVRPQFSEPDVLVTDQQIEAFMTECEAAGVLPVIGSISEEDFTPERLSRIRDLLAPHGIHATSHLAETTWRDALARENCGSSPVQAMARYGYYDHRHLASHMVHLGAEDIAITAERGAKVISTPAAEMKIADGVAPVPALLAAGVEVALGSDGALWNNGNDLFREMRVLQLVHSLTTRPGALTAPQILQIATRNGAAAFGLADVGSITPGWSADFVLVDVTAPRMRPLNITAAENLTAALVGLTSGADVTDVFIRGERVVAEGKAQTIDRAAVLAGAQAAHERIATAIGRMR